MRTASELPVNLAAEREVLGVALEEDRLLDEVIAADLTVNDFLLEDHRRVFTAMLRLREQQGAVDLITLAEQLGNRPEDVALLADLITGAVLVRGHVLHHVAIVRKKARLRSLIKVGEWLISSAREDGADPETLVMAASEKLEQIR